ncbi:Glycosyltransferase [Paraburkholderia caribensis MBA4]|uniref:Glycosyltransferase n=2 Tax=Paraburkholderia caribensis TaxID=75105 RepID=A0A0N7JUU1_9BURK|nr:Glycosyltransferase [Paraburkholderia caribensis MBA4]
MPINEYAQAREEMDASGTRNEKAASSEEVGARPLLHDHVLGDSIPSQSAIRKMKEKAKSILPDTLFLSLLHRKCIGRYPRLARPATFNEKILQRNLRPDPRYVRLTDKLEVREYVAARLGEAHLVPLIAAPEAFTRAVFDSLPDAFVMKANHGSTFVEIVRDKSETTFERLQELSERWLSTSFYWVARERHYRKIRPRIFFEQLLLDHHGRVPADFKVHCFGGHAGRPLMYILLITDRFGNNTHGDVFDAQWRHMDVMIGPYTRSAEPPPRPDNLEAVLKAATVLAKDFDYVRVDLYAPDNRVYFGELTFTPGAGVLPFTPDHVDYEWGQLLGASADL